MFQRIQTLYMLAVTVLSVALYRWFPIVGDPDGNLIMHRDEPVFWGAIAAVALLAVLAVLSFKNRKRQFVLNRLNILLNLVLLGMFLYHSLRFSDTEIMSENNFTMFFPALSIILLALANRAILKDERLVRSADRLR